MALMGQSSESPLFLLDVGGVDGVPEACLKMTNTLMKMDTCNIYI